MRGAGISGHDVDLRCKLRCNIAARGGGDIVREGAHMMFKL
jgi:hypothetical protein